MKTAFLGDSLTEGVPGVSYRRYLHDKSQLINLGLGGDTLIGALNRVGKILKNPKYNDVGQYIVEIGTNDVLLPTLEKHSNVWKLIVKVKARTHGCIPCKDIDEFSQKYDNLLCELVKHGKKIGVIGLPLIENSALTINQVMDEYNSVVINLCKKYNVPFLDMKQLEIQAKGDNKGTYFFSKTNLGIIADTVFSTILPFSMLISKFRGLAVTIDSVHLNKYMAKKLAEAVELKFLQA